MYFRFNETKENIDVLYLDDDTSHQDILVDSFSKLEPFLSFHNVQNIADIGDLMQTVSIDCMLVGHTGSGEDVFQLGDELRKLTQVPMILYADRRNEGIASKAFDARFNDYVVKNLEAGSLKALAQRIKSHVRIYLNGLELSEKERLYELLFENIQEGLWMMDEENRTQYVSPQLASMLGYTVEEIQETSFFDFIPPDNHEFINSKLEERREGLKDVYSSSYLHKDGHIIPVLITTTPILDQYNKYTGVIAGVLDLSEYDEIRGKLRETETLWRAVVENAPIIIASISPDFKLKFLNRTVDEEIVPISLSIIDYFDEEYIEVTKENLRKVFVDKESVTYESRVVHDDGRIIWYENKVAPIIENGEVTQALYISDEITRKKLFENELQVIKAMTELFLENSSINEIYATIPQLLTDNFAFEQAAIEKYDAENNTMVFLGTSGFPPRDDRLVVPVDETVSGIVVSTRKPFITSDTGRHPSYVSPELLPLKAKTFISLPITLQGRIFGALSLSSELSYDIWPELIETLEVIAYHISLELDRRLISDELQTREEQLNNFFSSATENFLLLDSNMVIEKANPGFTVQTERNENEIIGMHILDVFPDLEQTGRYRAYQKVIETGEPVFFDNIETFSIHGRRLIDLRAFKVGDGIGLISNDVTARKLYEERLEVLLQHASGLVEAGSFDEIAEITLRAINDTLETSIVSFYVVNEENVSLLLSSKPEISGAFKIELHGPGVIARALRTGETQLVADTNIDTDYLGYPSDNGALHRSELTVPIYVENMPYAAINLESIHPNAYSEEDKTLVELLVEHVTSNLIRIIESGQRVKYESQLETLAKYSSSLNQTTSLEEISDIVVGVIQDVLGFTFGGVAFIEGDHLIPGKRLGKDSDLPFRKIKEHGVVRRAIESGKVQLVPDTQKDPDYVAYPPSIVNRSELVVPILKKDQVIGVIDIEASVPNAFSSRDLRLIELFVENVTSSVLALERYTQTQYLEERWRSFLESSKDAIVVFQGTKVVYANQSYADLVGFKSPDHAIGVDLEALIPEESRSEIISLTLRRQAGESGPERYEGRLRRLDGHLIEIEVVANLMEYDGRPAALSFVRDITNRKQMEYSRERELAVTTALSELYEPLIRADSSLQEITDVLYHLATRLTESDLGYIASVDRQTMDLINHSLQFSTHKCEIDSSQKLLRFPANPDGSYSGLWGFGVSEKQAFYTNDVPNHPSSTGVPDGHMPLKRFMSVPVTLENELVGQIALANSSRDYTDDDLYAIGRLAEFYSLAIQRRRIEELYRTVVENSTNGISILDENMTILYSNSMHQEIFGYSREEMIGKSAFYLLHPDEFERMRTQGENRFKGLDAPTLYEIKGLHKSGRVLEIEVSSTLIEYLGKPAALSFLVDVTESREVLRELERERIKLEQAEELDEMKTRFIGTATHELRTPVTAIKGYLELLKVGAFGNIRNEVSEIIEIVDRNSDRLSRLTDDLLDMQRIESGRLTIRKINLDVEQVLTQIIEEMQPHFTEKNQTVSVIIPQDLPPMELDEIRITQVIYNLMSNASKFSPEDSMIKVKVSRAVNGVLFQVIDQGIGLSKEDLSRAFNPFPNIKKEKHVTGTGLGLSITRGIIELHGGQIWLESDGENKGTTVNFILPSSS